MPFPNKINQPQIVGLVLIIIGTIISLIFKDATPRFPMYACVGTGFILLLNDPIKSASLNIQLPLIALRVPGSAALVTALIIIDPIGRFYITSPPKTIAILVHGKASKGDLILKGHGFVEMHINGAILQEPIDFRGSVKFSNLRKGDTFTLSILDSEPFYTLRADSVYKVGEENEISLIIYLKGIDRVFGFVSYHENSLAGVHVSIDSLDTLTDSLGRFSLSIPESMQQQKYTVKFDKPAFKSITATAYPESSKPLSVNLEKR